WIEVRSVPVVATLGVVAEHATAGGGRGIQVDLGRHDGRWRRHGGGRDLGRADALELRVDRGYDVVDGHAVGEAQVEEAGRGRRAHERVGASGGRPPIDPVADDVGLRTGVPAQGYASVAGHRLETGG